MNKIKKVSKFFYYFFILLTIALPITTVAGWYLAPDNLVLFGNVLDLETIPNHYPVLHPLSVSERCLGIAATFLPVSITMAIFYFLVKLFSLFEKGVLFSVAHVHYLRKIGYALLLSQVISPVYQMLIGFIVTSHNPHGYRIMSITFSQSNIVILIIAMLVILMSWIMSEGFKLAEENQLIV